MQIVKELTPHGGFSADALRAFFIDHLNRIYCAKSHLAERLPEIIEYTEFSDLRFAIQETLEDVEKQLIRMDAIYSLLDAENSFQDCNGLISLVDDAFGSIYHHRHNAALSDMGILFYMHNIESLEMASFKVLLIIASQMGNDRVKQLLKENYDEATADKTLLLLILAKYVRP